MRIHSPISFFYRPAFFVFGLLWLWMGLRLPLAAQNISHCFPVWQGFTQTWGYNHRINRLGDWVENASEGDSCKVLAAHSAASGSGSDLAQFQQFYTLIQSPLLQTAAGSNTFSLSGREGAYIAEVQTAEARFLELSAAANSYAVLLNGFDLSTANGAKADKIQALDIAIDSTWRNMETKTIHFRFKVQMRFSCSSPECEMLNQIVDYRLKVYWLVINGEGFQAKNSTFGSGAAWEKLDTAAALPLPQVALLGDARYDKASAGITGLHIQLDDEYHILGWESQLHTRSYGNGLLMVQLGIGFKQNAATMYAAYKQRYHGCPKPPAKMAVKRHAGNMAWSMDVCLLQFEDAMIVDQMRAGQIDWQTKHHAQSAAEGKAAEHIEIIDVELR